MKVSPVSADLLIKLAVGLVAIGAAVYLVKKGMDGISGALGSVGKVYDAVAENVAEALSPTTITAVMLPSNETTTTGENYGHEGRNYEKPLIGWNNIGVTAWGIAG